MDRFDLEAALTDFYTTNDEISILIENLEKVSTDDLYNCLIGIVKINEFRCKKAFEIFENMLKKELISSKV